MEYKHLRPDKLDIDPNSTNACRKWKQWNRLFTNFLNRVIAAGAKKETPLSDQDKLDTLCIMLNVLLLNTLAKPQPIMKQWNC